VSSETKKERLVSEEPVFINFFLRRWLRRFREVRARRKLARQERIDELLGSGEQMARATRTMALSFLERWLP